MRSGAVVLKRPKRSVLHGQVEDERDPVPAPAHSVEEQLVTPCAGAPLEAGRHGQQVFDRQPTLQLLVRTGSVLWEEAQDTLVDSLDEPPVYGNADEAEMKLLVTEATKWVSS